MKMYFKCEKRPDGSLTEWAIIAALPEEWPPGATVGMYPHSGNKIYNVPGDQVRYYEMMDGTLCQNCKTIIDKTVQIHAEDRVDRERCLCQKCWQALYNSEEEPQTSTTVLPLYRLRNSLSGVNSGI